MVNNAMENKRYGKITKFTKATALGREKVCGPKYSKVMTNNS